MSRTPRFLNLGTRWRWVVSCRSCKTPTRRTHGAHSVEGWVVSEPIGCCEQREISCPWWYPYPSSSTPYPNHYTDYVVPSSPNIWVSQMKHEYYLCNKYEWTSGLLDIVGFTGQKWFIPSLFSLSLSPLSLFFLILLPKTVTSTPWQVGQVVRKLGIL